ncbi:MAG: response regulator [Myxococcota bacterium]
MSDVLVIDDEHIERILLTRLVSKIDSSIEVVVFDYAEEAMSYLRSPERKVPRLIFVDINMPRVDGFQFAEDFAELYPELRGDSQVWMMSNSIDPRDRERAEKSPSVQGYIEKSGSDQAFLDVISGAFGAN